MWKHRQSQNVVSGHKWSTSFYIEESHYSSFCVEESSSSPLNMPLSGPAYVRSGVKSRPVSRDRHLSHQGLLLEDRTS